MADKYNIQRSRLHIAKVGTATLRDVGNIESASYSFDEQKITKQSTNEVVGEIASKVISTSGTLTVTFGSLSFENFVLALRARTSAQAAVTDGAFTFPVLAAGESFQLPHGNVSAVTIPGKVEGVDFKVLKTSGIVSALVDNASAIAGCSYASGVMNAAGIAAAAAVEYSVIFTDELNGEETRFYKWQPNLPQNINLVNINEFGTLEVTGSLLLDTSRPADGALGQYGYKREALTA